MSIKLRLPKGHLQNLRVLPDYTVESVRSLAAARLSPAPPSTSIHLVHGGSVLSDGSAKLADLVEPDAILSVVVAQGQQDQSLNTGALFPLLSHLPPPSDQTAPNREIALVTSFLHSLSDAEAAMWQPEQADLAVLAWAASALEQSQPAFKGVPHITWFGEYGCALLATMPRVGEVVLMLVCPDEWKFYLHCGEHSRTHCSLAGADATPLHVGCVSEAEYGDFLFKTYDLLGKAASRTGDKRSANRNPQGNQKTPAMVQAVLLDALAGLDEGQTAPRGGFTDVGLHTGGHARSTTWPLVRAVMQVLLESREKHQLYRVAMAELQLWSTERALPVDSAQGSDAAMQMLKAAVSEGAALADEGHDMGGFEARCVLVRYELECAAEHRASLVAQSFELPPVHIEDVHVRPPELSLPVPRLPAWQSGSLEASRERALDNLGWLPTPPVLNTWPQLSKWLALRRLQPGQSGGQDEAAMLLVVSTVESFAFRQTDNLNATSYLSGSCLRHMEGVVETYRLAVAQLQQSKTGAALLSVEVKSRELLVVWVAFCMAHHATRSSNPLLGQYRAAPQWEDLQLLVLSERSEVDSALQVAAYLRRVNRQVSRPVFSLRPDDATIDLARRYAYADPSIQETWRVEQAAAVERQAQHWRDVLAKQQHLRQLDAKLQEETRDRDSAQAKLNRLNKPRNGWKNPTSKAEDILYSSAKSELDIRENTVSWTTQVIRAAESPPSPVKQPLPFEASAAMPVLFLLFMPEEYCVLSRLSFTAQQMLLPGDNITLPALDAADEQLVDVNDLIAVDGAKTWWQSYYMSGSTARSHTSKGTKVLVGSMGVDGDWYPKNVRKYFDPTQGIWHPDTLQPALFWDGGGFSLDTRLGDGLYSPFFDPFKTLPAAMAVHKFTEPLPEADHALQWALEQHGCESAPARGNWPEAVLDTMPAWLPSKQHFLAFGALRAYPLQQMRKLCVALRDRSLPLDHPSVRLLLQQTLFHVGQLSDDDMPRQLWRTDMAEDGGWAALRRELDELVDELRHKPREHGAVLVLGEIAAVASQWDSATRETSRQFAQISRAWADEVAAEIEGAEVEQVPVLRARRCLFYMYAIVCHCAGELSVDDVGELMQLVLLADYNRLFEDPTPYDAEVQALKAVTLAVMARRLSEVLDVLDQHTHLLTAAVNLVLDATPSELTWRRVVADGDTECYEAVSSSGNLYSLNAMTGVLLFNGLPPSRLPQSILQMPLYRRTFSDRNFEVTASSDGSLLTARPLGGHMYSFFVDESGALVVQEIDPSSLHKLELLDGTGRGVAVWGGDLPIRLQRMHSHWLCRETDTVVLRGQLYLERGVSFFLEPALNNYNTSDAVGNGSLPMLCFCVGENQRQVHWTKLRSFQPGNAAGSNSFDQLVIQTRQGESQLLRVLEKLETDAGLVHTLRESTSGAFLFELPRYDLAFQLVEGQLQCMNYRGFQLGVHQLLPDQLRGFQQYLVLEAASARKVIVPEGTVERQAHRVSVQGPSSCDAHRSLHAYDEHGRFGTLEAAAGPLAVEARLQLAALHAATGAEVPEPSQRRTGGEAAVELLRQSWVNQPLSRRESGHLQSIVQFGMHTPALALLCQELDQSARELSFLHTDRREDLRRPPMQLDIDAASDYSHRKQRGQLNPRAALSADEETRVLGLPVTARPQGRVFPEAGYLDLSSTDVPAMKCSEVAASIEDALRLMVCQQPRAKPAALPLNVADFQDSQLGRSLVEQLQQSWAAYQNTGAVRLVHSVKHTKGLLRQHLIRIRDVRGKLEAELLRNVSHVPAAAGWHASAFNMRRAANLEPVATARDVARAAWAPKELRRFNPFLSGSAVLRLNAGTLTWLQACVLEDKLRRACDLASVGSVEELERELQEVGREWDVQQHPQWLVFEVEQQLQIRKVQYRVAHFLTEHPGAITQLNMGEGKTRVILPMLLLSMAQPDLLLRLHFLSPLLGEAYHFLHCQLTASLMNRRMYLMPFHRDVRLDPQSVQRMHESLLHCKASLGALCIAPEHRLSLLLKRDELAMADGQEAMCTQLRKVIDELPYLDLLDESDEMLSHKYQLIYAVGSCCELPAGKERWVGAQALLRQLQTSTKIAAILQDPDVARRLSAAERGAGAFDDTRLLQGPWLDAVTPELLRLLIEGVMDDPPYHMRWL